MFRLGKNFQSFSFAFTNREGYDISSNEETFAGYAMSRKTISTYRMPQSKQVF